MKKVLISLLLITVFNLSSFASHFSGGEIFYNWNGTNYTVTVKLYGSCVMGTAGMPLTADIVVRSASKNVYNKISLAKIKEDTLSVPCSLVSSCVSPATQVPDFKVYTYQDTVSLVDTASDWVFHWWSGARAVTANLFNSQSNVYIEATLDNTGGENSIAYTPTTFPIITGMIGTKIDLQTLDYDGDSIVIENITPMKDSVTSYGYAINYSAASPLGTGVAYSINNKTLELGATSIQGFFALAYRVKEYRNGTLIASHIHDYMLTYMPSLTNVNRPVLTYGPTDISVCPGKTQSFTLGFSDTLTDSVFVMIGTPTYSNWAFQTVNNPGLGSASIDVSFTAPTTLNPQTEPFFYIDVLVYDNGCPRNATKYAVLVRTRACNTDSVWAGDANYDKVVNLLDPLAIALSYGQTGTVRANASTAWVPQYSVDWGANIPLTAIDNKHADCNGDGTVNATDLGAIVTNWSKTHAKGGASAKTTAATELYFDLAGISFVPGAKVDIPIKIKGASSLNNFYGLSSEVGMMLNASLPSNQISVSPSTGWLGNAGNTLAFNKALDNGTVAWAYARNNHIGVSGNGTVGTLSFEIPANAQNGDRIDMSFRSTTLIDATGKVLDDYTAIDAVAYVWPLNVSSIANAIDGVMVVPNPSQNKASLQLTLNKEETLTVTVTDITGKNLWTVSSTHQKGYNEIALPTTELASGMYMIQVKTTDGNTQTLKWVKQ